MLLVKDLNITGDVLPLFDFTNNEHAAVHLREILENLPDSIEEVYERQDNIKGIIENWTGLESFHYQRFDLMEVYTFLEGIGSNRIILDNHKFKTAIRLYFREEEKYKRRSQFVQLALFLVRIQRQFFSRIDRSKLPEEFIKQLEQALAFLRKLDLETVEKQIREDRFSVIRIVDFSGKLSSLSGSEIHKFWKFFFTFEAYWSIAKGVMTHRLTFPKFSENAFQIADFYHPAIKNPVKNSLVLGSEENVVLLTGPNMSGKSTMLKAIGICVYLAHAGLGVPAINCQIPFFHSIVVAINLSDNLQDGYSHFMSEIRNLKSVLQETENSRKCFAIFDEIFRGTNIDDALQITRTTINGLGKYKDSCFFISTHLLQLESELSIQNNYIRKQFIDCSMEGGVPRFTYSLKEGWSQLKIGKILFDKEGLTDMLAV